MYLKYDNIGDRTLLHLPADKLWALRFRIFDEDGCEDYSVSLAVAGEKPIPVLDADLFCQGNPDLPRYAVGRLYEELIDTAAAQLEQDPAPPQLDIPALVRTLVDTKYRALWVKKGYIPADLPLYV